MKPKERDKALRILLTAFGNRCWYCGDGLLGKERHVDHILAKSRGGEDSIDNLALACKRCNMAKYADELDSFLNWLKKPKVPLFDGTGQHPLSRLAN